MSNQRKPNRWAQFSLKAIFLLILLVATFLAGRLYDHNSLNTIAAKLDDEQDWVVLNAISSIGRFGTKANPYVPRLEAIAASDNQQHADAARQALKQILDAGEESKQRKAKQQESEFRIRLRSINQYIDTRSGL